MKNNINRIVDFMRKISLTSSYPSFKVGAAVFSKNKLVSTGVNQNKTHPYVKQHGPSYSQYSVHAELDAIFKAKRKNYKALKGSTLVVYREDREGNIKNSRPCPMCMEKIQAMGIKFVIYSTEQGMVTEKVDALCNSFPSNYEESYPQRARVRAV